jgi:D-alanyl-D-alanine carboxypeptidase
MASLTKIMTCLVSIRLIKRFKLEPQNLFFSVSATAAVMSGTTAKLEEGEWILV